MRRRYGRRSAARTGLNNLGMALDYAVAHSTSAQVRLKLKAAKKREKLAKRNAAVNAEVRRRQAVKVAKHS